MLLRALLQNFAIVEGLIAQMLDVRCMLCDVHALDSMLVKGL